MAGCDFPLLFRSDEKFAADGENHREATTYSRAGPLKRSMVRPMVSLIRYRGLTSLRPKDLARNWRRYHRRSRYATRSASPEVRYAGVIVCNVGLDVRFTSSGFLSSPS
jgi:hypothetical protein